MMKPNNTAIIFKDFFGEVITIIESDNKYNKIGIYNVNYFYEYLNNIKYFNPSPSRKLTTGDNGDLFITGFNKENNIRSYKVINDLILHYTFQLLYTDKMNKWFIEKENYCWNRHYYDNDFLGLENRLYVHIPYKFRSNGGEYIVGFCNDCGNLTDINRTENYKTIIRCSNRVYCWCFNYNN